MPVRVGPGGPTPKEARGGRWRRSSRGFYVPASVDERSPEQRIAEAAVLVPDGGAITGWAALRWQGGRWFSGQDPAGEPMPVPVAVPSRRIRPRAGIRITEEAVDPDDIRVVDGVRVTDPRVAVLHELRQASDFRRAAVALDMACFDDLVSIDEVAELADATRARGRPRGESSLALGLAEENSWSPAESLARLVWEIDGGYPTPLCNQPVFTLDGEHLGTPDLLDPESGVVGEYDGRDHLSSGARRRDLQREGRFRRHGLEPVVIVAGDLHSPREFLGRLREAFSRATLRSFRPTWTLEAPDWWTPTHTVELRRSLPAHLRARLLRYRAPQAS